MVMKNLEENTVRWLGTYVNKDLEYKEINLKANFDEYIAIEVKLNDSEEILLINIYRSPASNDDNCTELNNILSELAGLKYQHKVIGGDLNYRGIDWKLPVCTASANSKDFLFLEAMRDAYLTQLMDVPTRWRGNDTPSTLDLMITNDDAVVEDIRVDAPLGKSDQALISARVVCQLETKHITKTRFIHDKANYEEMRVLYIDWEDTLNARGNDINKMWKTFESKMEEAEKLIPKKVITINDNKRKYDKPLDRKIAKIKRKNRLWER